MNRASLAVSCAGLVMWAACWLALQYYRHLHPVAHPFAVRAVIFFSYVAGCAVAQTVLGAYALDLLRWLLTAAGGAQSVTGHATVEVAAGGLFVTAAVALTWVPKPWHAYLAAATPFPLALSGGHLHMLLDIVPAPLVAAAFSQWIGG